MSDVNRYGDAYVPYQGGYTIEELVDLVQNELTISCALPKTLPDANIRQIIETRALPWFYRNYQYAVQKLYYFIDKQAFFEEEFTRYNYVNVPCEIQTVVYLYEVRGDSLFQLGINTPNLSVNLGVTNQPYLSSYVTTIGELGVYKTVLDFGNVVSGNKKSQYAVGLWQKLYRELPNEMVAVDPKTKKEYPVTTDEAGKLKIETDDDVVLYGEGSKVYLKLYQNANTNN